MRTSWKRSLALAPHALRPWLSTTSSLTARLIAHYPDFSVRVVRQALARPYLDEHRTLAAPPRGLIQAREVLLMSGETPLVFARSIVAPAALRRGFRALERLGNHSLGSFLFATPTISRSPLSWQRINRRHPLWHQAAQYVPALCGPLWARRSFFHAGADALMVTEVFLPRLRTANKT